MSAVSQSYPNYLGGLNEQPDELKKPGQLVEATNMIPDPVIGLSRRPGFKKIPIDVVFEPDGTWFEIKYSDSIYYGNISQTGDITIVNQEGESQDVFYSTESIVPHKDYTYKDGELTIRDENHRIMGDPIPVNETDRIGYFSHKPDYPLKYCVSKDHVVFTNPNTIPDLEDVATIPEADQRRYYSFINLKLIDTANYKYKFKRFYPPQDNPVQFTVVDDVTIENIVDLGADPWDKDLTYPLQNDAPVNGKWRFYLDSPGIEDNDRCIVDVAFRSAPQNKQSEDSGDNRVEAGYSWTASVVEGGKGYKAGQVFRKTLTYKDYPDLTITFKIKSTTQYTGVDYDPVLPSLPNDEFTTDDDAEDILRKLAADFKAKGIDNAVVVGSGIWLENSLPFSVSTSEIAVADVLNSQKIDDDLIPLVRVNTVAELPVECYPGFMVEVTNSFDDKNNYYLEYKTESKNVNNDVTDTKADGYWEEIAKPFETHNPGNSSLPHIITLAKEKDEQTDAERVVFIASPMMYKSRTAGTALDNPSMFTDRSPICDINYYKNRLFMFTKNGAVISSQAGKIDDLFIKTAINTSVVDPIDVIANSNQRVSIHGSIVVNNAMVLFGDTEQYSVTTDSSVLSTQTINVTKISNYTFDRKSTPCYVGTNVGFISDGLTRFYEMTNVYDRGPVDINERSQQVQTQFGQGFNMVLSSREQSQVVSYKNYSDSPSNELYLYRYRQENSQDSSQTSWTKWEFPEYHYISYVSLPEDKMFVFINTEDGVEMWSMDSETLKGVNGNPMLVPVYLDGWYRDEDGELQGKEFTSTIKFPTIYAQSKGAQPVSDVTANLTIHRVKLSTALIGPYNLTIDRLGYDSYDILSEGTPADKYKTNAPQLPGERVEAVPIYTRNKNLTLTMHTKFNAPLTLRSMTWEGDWNRPYYKSV